MPLTVSNNILGITWVMGLMLVPAVFFLVAGPDSLARSVLAGGSADVGRRSLEHVLAHRPAADLAVDRWAR